MQKMDVMKTLGVQAQGSADLCSNSARIALHPRIRDVQNSLPATVRRLRRCRSRSQSWGLRWWAPTVHFDGGVDLRMLKLSRRLTAADMNCITLELIPRLCEDAPPRPSRGRHDNPGITPLLLSALGSGTEFDQRLQRLCRGIRLLGADLFHHRQLDLLDDLVGSINE